MYVLRTIVIITATLFFVQACAPKDEPEAPAATSETSRASTETASDTGPTDGRGTLFVDDKFMEFTIANCTLDAGKSLNVSGEGEADGVGFELAIDGPGARVDVTFADGRTISGAIPEPFQVRNGSLSGQFEIAQPGGEPSFALLFAECSK